MEEAQKGNESFNSSVVHFAMVEGRWRERGIESLSPPAVPLPHGAGFSMSGIPSLLLLLGSGPLDP